MSAKPLNSEAYRTLNNKQNCTSSFLTYDTESLMQQLARNEQAITEMRRDMREKVGKHEFITALSSKVSLSEVTNLSLDINQSYETNHSRTADKEKQLSIMQVRTELQKMKQDINEINGRTNYQSYMDGKQVSILKLIRESEQGLLDRMEKKAQRSELDKIMHLSSLLAIEFELIKKRFGNFEVDYNLIWKEISNLYSYQENIKTALDTERLNVGSVEREIKQISDKERQLQILLRTSQKISGMSSLFKSLGVSPKREEEKAVEEQKRIDYGLQKLEEKLENIRMSELNTQFSIKSFSERLRVIQDNYENKCNSMKQIHELKEDFIQAKQQVSYLYMKTDSFKQTVAKSMNQKMDAQLLQLYTNIKAQIVQACEEISQKVMNLFGQCARENDLLLVRSNVDRLDQLLTDKISAVLQTNKKNNQHFSSKLELQQDKIRLVQKDLGHRVREEDFNKEVQKLITSQAALTLVKKAEGNLKQEVSKFVTEQQSINEVICAQTVIARWLWISGELKGGNLVSWDKQIINTLPENFKYSSKDYCFRIASSGIYRIEMGYYSKKKPTVQIIVNGQTVVSAINSNAYVLHHSSGKLKDVGNGEITGLTYYDFLMLPENSRLAISYQGQPGHGFLALQRL